MLRRFVTLAAAAAFLSGFAGQASAESEFAKFIRGGQKPIHHGGGYVSDKSPIPRQKVRFADVKEKGVIVIDTSERRLY